MSDPHESRSHSHLFQTQVKRYLLQMFGADAVVDPSTPNNAAVPYVGNDGGRDYEVHAPQDRHSELFGVRLRPGARCLIEAKYTRAGAINFARVSSNLARIQDAEADHIFVVTNAHFAPSSQVDVHDKFRGLRDRLYLVEGRAFRHWCELHAVPWPDAVAIVDPANERASQDGNILIEANSIAVRETGGQIQMFSIAFRNLDAVPRTVVVFATSDIEWRFTDRNPLDGAVNDLFERHGGDEQVPRKTLVIPPWGSRALRLSGRFLNDQTQSGLNRAMMHGDKRDGARIVAEVGREHISLFAGLRPIRIVFRPRFVGRQNILLRDELAPLFLGIERGIRPARLRLVHIRGGAGVGKSRLVDEILPPIGGASHLVVLEHTVSSDDGDEKLSRGHWTNVRKLLAPHCAVHAGILDDITDVASLLDVLCGSFQQVSTLANWGAIIVVIEDLHNAGPDIFEALERLQRQDHALNVGIFVVLTGREDDSYINPEYRRFSMELPARPVGGGVETPVIRSLGELTTAEAKMMIGDLVEGIQDSGIERIFSLSSAVPHHIVQCVEYLLDASLVAITHRDTLSIIDPLTFEKRIASLPRSMNALFATRFEVIGRWRGEMGLAAQNAILAATVFGTRFPREVGGLIDGVPADEIVQELEDRRFFSKASSDDHILQWHHENLLLFFDTHRRAKAQRLCAAESAGPIGDMFVDNARLIRRSSALWERLTIASRGDIATLLDDMPLARRCFSEICDSALKISTFNTLDAKPVHFQHVEYVVAALRDESPERREALIWRLIVLKAFIGAYYRGLRHEIEAYEYGMRALPLLGLSVQNMERGRRWLLTIDAQAHLDSGFIGAALDRLLRLQHLIQVDMALGGQTDFDIQFDLYNSLRLLFIHTNFVELADCNGKLAHEYLRLSGTSQLEAVDLGDLALFFMLTDRRRCIALLEEALRIDPSRNTMRHSWHCEFSLLAALLPDQVGDTAALQAADTRATEIWRDCESEGYRSILPRIYLLRAVIAYLLGRGCHDPADLEAHMDAALAIADQGLNACEAYSIGQITWQIYNLKAIIHGRRSEWKTATDEMKSAIVRMDNDGLTFMGRDGLISVAPQIFANFIKLADSHVPDREALNLLSKLHGFERYKWNDAAYLREAKAHAAKYHHIVLGCKHWPDWLLLDEVTGLSITCWF
ncbi:MAG: hypothetical protein JWO81_1731 [Alphaproteobacteria bacterium]|nr:hypothetical protein [Alphaproteobacteria bacterium]